MNKMMLELDLGFCDCCDSWVSVVEVDGDVYCKSEYDMYGAELANIIR